MNIILGQYEASMMNPPNEGQVFDSRNKILWSIGRNSDGLIVLRHPTAKHLVHTDFMNGMSMICFVGWINLHCGDSRFEVEPKLMTTQTLPPGVSIVRSTRFKSKDFSTGSLEMRTNGKLWSVIRGIPPGMDITERDHWQFRSRAQADATYDSLAIWFAERGFNTL